MQYRFRKVRIFLMTSLYIALSGCISKDCICIKRKLLDKFIIFVHDYQMTLCPFKRKGGHYFKVIFNVFLYKHLKCSLLWFLYLPRTTGLVFVLISIILDHNLMLTLCFVI